MFAGDEEENANALQQALELAASGSSRLPSVDLEREVVPALPALPGFPSFEPLGDSDVYDVFDLELTLEAGGKEAGIDARYRSSDSSSGRPTFKIRKRTRAHFLGKKNMNVDVSRSLAWDPTTATVTPKGSKSYANVFSAQDQSSRRVALQATNSVLSKTSSGAVVDVSTVCGAHDPTRTLHRDTTAHHFVTLKLNPSCAPEKPVTRKRGNGSVARSPSASPSSTDPYIGGGHFVLDSAAPPERSDLLTTLYCTGYDQRPRVRAGDITVAEICLPPRPVDPGAVPPSPWARFFKERHAVLRIARRGLGACMTGPHVQLSVPGVEHAVLARGQALEVVLAVVGTALLAVEHDGFEGKRWAWLAQRGAGAQGASLSRMATPTETPMGTGMALSRTATATEMGVTLSRMASRTGTSAAQPRTGTRTLQLSPLASPPAVADNPGLASPDGEGTDAHSDDSQNSPTPAGFDQYRLFAPPGHYQDQQNFVPMNGGSAGADREDLDDWVVAEDAAHPGDAGSWARKSTITSYSESAMLGSQHHDSHQHQHQHEHLKVGSWPGPERRSVVRMLERPQSQAGLGENPNWTPNANGQGEHADGSGTFALGENNMNGFDGNSNAHAHPDPDALGAHANRAPVASTLSRMWMKKQQQPTPNPYPTPQEHMY